MIRSTIVFALATCMLTGFSSAQDEEKQKKKGSQRGNGGIAAQMMARFKDVGLSDEQKGKMKEIIEKHSAKLTELRKQVAATLSPEQRRAKREAGKKAREEGLKGKELQTAIDKSLGEEVVAKMKELQTKMAAMQKEMREALTSVLTDEQKEKLPKRGPGKGGKKGKKKKKNKKKDDQ